MANDAAAGDDTAGKANRTARIGSPDCRARKLSNIGQTSLPIFS
jgi:hypothetical protein